MPGSERTLTISIRRRDGSEHCELELDTPDGRDVAESPFASPARASDLDDLIWLIEDYPRILGQAGRGIAERIERRLSDLGRELREAVFGSGEQASAIRAALVDQQATDNLHVRVDSEHGARWVPWELLACPGSDRPLSLQAASFVRVVRRPVPPSPPSFGAGAALRILIVVARPSDDDVTFRSVASRIVRAASLPGSPLRITILRPPTFAALAAALAAARNSGEPFDAVHFDGHGVYREPVFTTGSKRGYLRFESDSGAPDEVSGSAVGQLLAEHGVRLLLLNACRSAFADTADQDGLRSLDDAVLGSVASDVFAAGVDGVLAMGFDVYVATAARLIASTYAAIGAGRSLGEAVAHARRAEAARERTSVVSGYEWLVPVVYEAEAVRLAAWTEHVPELSSATDTTTPDPATLAEDGPPSVRQRFFGYDNILLRLDRALHDSPVVELIGIAGAGKSTVAAEFARWSVATGAARSVLVLDASDYPSAAALGSLLAERMSTASVPVLVLVENADGTELADVVEEIDAGRGRVLLTGRAPAGLAGAITIIIDGLDAEASQELAAEHGWDPAVPGAAAVLEWAQGVPALIRRLPEMLAAAAPASIDDTYELLFSLRDGGPSSEQERQRLLDWVGLEVFDVARLTDPTLPLALMLFHEYLAVSDWQTFCQLRTFQGWPVEDDPAGKLTEQLGPGVAAGLACQHGDHGFRLHPLAPAAMQLSFGTIVTQSTQGDTERFKLVRKRLWAVYAQTIRLSGQVLRLPQPPAGQLDLARRAQRQNLMFAVQLSVNGAWWALAFPLVRRLRDELLAEQRVDEWSALFNRIVTLYQEYPPTESEMGPENVPMHMTRLQAEEAERAGDLAEAERLRQQATRQALAQNLTLTPVEPAGPEDESDGSAESGELGGRRVFDINVGPRFSALIKQGDVLANQKSGDCLRFYSEACQLAEEADDDLRLAEAQLATARAHLNVPPLYDPEEYELWARRALATAEGYAAFDPDLFARCKLSLGTAILEQTKRGVELTPDRLTEARGCLLLAANAEAVTPRTRAMARNSLGILMYEAGDPAEAAAEYLQASAEFEALSDWNSVAAGQVNAAAALSAAGKAADASSVARQALVTLDKAPDMRDELAPRLAEVLGSASDYSHSEPVQMRCASCAHNFTGELWLIIDVIARRDLYRKVLDGTIHQLRCPNCLAWFAQISIPLCLLRLDTPVKLIASLPDGEVADERGQIQHLLTFLATRMDESWNSEWPQTAMVRVAESRLADQLADDWSDLGRFSPGDPLLAKLTGFLNTADPEGKRALLAEFPDLVGPSSLILLSHFAAAHREQGHDDRADDVEAQLSLLIRVREIGADPALAEYGADRG